MKESGVSFVCYVTSPASGQRVLNSAALLFDVLLYAFRRIPQIFHVWRARTRGENYICRSVRFLSQDVQGRSGCAKGIFLDARAVKSEFDGIVCEISKETIYPIVIKYSEAIYIDFKRCVRSIRNCLSRVLKRISLYCMSPMTNFAPAHCAGL